MGALIRVSRLIDQVTGFFGWLTFWFTLAMVGIGVYNVIARYIGRAIGQNLSTNTLIELQWYLFSLVFFLAAAYTLRHDGHVRVDVFYGRWNPRRQAIADIVGTLLYLIPFSIMVIWFSWGPISSSWRIFEGSPDPGGLPRYPIKTMIIIGFALIILQGISEIIKKVAFLQGRLPERAAIEHNEGEVA